MLKVSRILSATTPLTNAAFKAWFAGSKIVDASGNPLRVFHGTTKGPSDGVFRLSNHGYIFVTPQPHYADTYTGGRWDKGQIFPLYAKASNPLDLREAGSKYLRAEAVKELLRGKGVNPDSIDFTGVYKAMDPICFWIRAKGFKEAVMAAGYDAIWQEENSMTTAGDDALVLFSPSQLKSAIGNTGDYLPEDHRITASRSATIGFNVNDSEYPWTDLILQGTKTIETRNSPSLSPHIGEEVGIVRTGGRGVAALVGYCILGKPVIYHNNDEFRADQKRHQVPEGAEFDIQPGAVKYGYPMTKVRGCKPTIVRSQGRVWRKL